MSSFYFYFFFLGVFYEYNIFLSGNYFILIFQGFSPFFRGKTGLNKTFGSR